MKKLIAFILACLFLFGFISCDKENAEQAVSEYDSEAYPFGPPPAFNPPVVVDPEDPFTGTWADIYGDNIMQTLYAFTGDGRGFVDITDIRYYFEYTYDDTTLILHEYPDTMDEYRERIFEYKIEGNNLILTYELEDYLVDELSLDSSEESGDGKHYATMTWYKQ